MKVEAAGSHMADRAVWVPDLVTWKSHAECADASPKFLDKNGGKGTSDCLSSRETISHFLSPLCVSVSDDCMCPKTNLEKKNAHKSGATLS